MAAHMIRPNDASAQHALWAGCISLYAERQGRSKGLARGTPHAPIPF
jgi:hypothetical protein